MKCVILVFMVMLCGCSLLKFKPGTLNDEYITSSYIDNKKVLEGSVKYIGKDIYSASFITGKTCSGLYFIIVVEEEEYTVYWSKDGKFEELEDIIYLDLVTRLPVLL